MKTPSIKQSQSYNSGGAGGPSSSPISAVGSPFEHRVARAISACTRCRSRKSKCDGKLPACTACEKAGVECVGFDAISKRSVGRSYIHELEQEVVQLRRRLGMSTEGFGAAEETLGSSTAASGSFSPGSRGVKHEHQQQLAPPPPPPAIAFDDGNLSGRSAGGWAPPSTTHDPSIDPAMAGPSRPSPSSSISGPGHGHYDANGGPGGGSSSSTSNGHRQHVDGVLSDMTFAAVESSFDGAQRQAASHAVGHFMGASSGVSLARIVLDAVLREGVASGPQVPDRKLSMEPATSRPLSPSMGHQHPSHSQSHSSPDHLSASNGGGGGGSSSYPTSHQRGGDGAAAGGGGGGGPGSSYHSPNAPSSHHRRVNIPALPPPAAVDRLVQVYVDFVQIMLPILHMPTFAAQLARVRDRSDDATEADVFFVLMVLALSTMALSRSLDPTAELRMSSEAFYVEASKHMEDIFEDNTYAGLQAILLCCYYSLLNPARGSVWHLVGLASRVCVDYGFHHETEQQLGLSPLELDMRRRLFAAVYNLDRLLCHALGRPPSIPDDFIDVPPFSNLPDTAITDRGLLPSEPDPYKVVALNFVPLRELQSVISSRLYSVRGSEPPPEEWFMTMFDKLKTWLANSPEPRGSSSTEGYAISFHNTVLLLFRPSPACPRPSRDALATCLSSSSYIIRIFRSMQRKNKINWWWLSCHYVFMAGITYLYGLWNMNLLGDSSVTPSLMEAHLDIQACSSTLEALAVNVPSAHACKSTFEMLSSAILRRLSGEQAFEGSESSNSGREALAVPPAGGGGVGATGSSGGSGSSSSSDPQPAIGKAGVHAESAMRHSFQSRGLPSPLPKLDLPTELRLLDNLFLNPMVPHPKASDSTTYHEPYAGTPGATPAPEAAPPQQHHHHQMQQHLQPSGRGSNHNSPYVPSMPSYLSAPSPSGSAVAPSTPSMSMNMGMGAGGPDSGLHALAVAGLAATAAEGGQSQGHISVLPSHLQQHHQQHDGTVNGNNTNLHNLNNGGMPGGGAGASDLAANGFDFLTFLAADDGGQGANAVWEQTEAYRQDMPML